jgi:DNA-binding response OmpR family regulator
LISAVLSDQGRDVKVAATGKAAIDAFKTSRFDLVTIDYQLPDMTGLDIARNFIATAPDVPLVIITSRGNEGVAVEAIRLGVTNYIIKDSANSFLNLLPATVYHAL